MANNKIIPTIFQNLDRTFSGNWDMAKPNSNSYDIKSDNDILYKTDNKEKYEKTKLELQQNNYLANRWQKANVDLSLQAFNGLNNVKLMYRDVDLMDSFPEIGAALDIVSEEAAQLSDKGQIINVYSQSERIKSVLEDLFINRLDLHATAQMVIRGMCKYGNQFMLLNIDNKLGITGWRQLPVFNMERVEHGIENPYSSKGALAQGDKTDMQTKFIWMDEANQAVPFRNWQIGHFRLINNSMYLPYGVSYLNNARRHWRLLSLMEDMMMIYRLERSMERRVYKIFVGAIDDADIPAYVQEVANNFKRTPIIDPLTGQLDLRKNILPVWKKTPIPLLDGRTITIEELSKEFKEGKENFVYSVQDNTKQIVPGKVVWCGKNYEAKNMIKVTLDDDTYCVMAPEHEVLMRDGSKKRADMLSVNDSVMPFYTKLDKKSEHLFDRYEKVYNPNSGKFEPTHRLVAQDLPKEIETYNTVHHKDFDKYNNNPTNLLWCDYHEHHKMHGDLARRNWNDPIKRSKMVAKLSKSTKERFKNNPFSEEVKEKISNTLKRKYESGELDFVKENSSKTITEFNKLNSTRELRREFGRRLGYRKEFKEYNESELHKQHDLMKHYNMIELWKDRDSEKMQNWMSNMTVKFDDFVWKTIEQEILNFNILSQNDAIKFVNNNLIDYLISINESQKLKNYKKITKPLFRARLTDKGFTNFEEYICTLIDYDTFKKNKYAKMHCGGTLELNEEGWRLIRENILNGVIKVQQDAIEYTNKNLLSCFNKDVSEIKHTSFVKLIRLRGFSSWKEFFYSIKKNHKVKSIEVINGDDVYCMTVVGLNGEEDRHNFALRTFNEDESWCENGIFVSNCVDNDVFIPTRDANAPTPIDTLPAAQNLTAIDDIKFIQKKVLAALRIPRAFLNFDESTGEGKNLALLDIRFARTINRIQQAFLMELTKIATIHLYILGFEDELTNFSLSMNNPSTQAEGLEIENIQKKIQAIRDAVADPGGGIPIMSLQRALRQIMKFSDKDIQENLEEIRLERALASELEKTSQIIQRTKIFDSVDRMYGEPNAEYQDGQEQGQGMDGGMPMGGGGGMPMGDIGGDIPTEGEGELGGLGELGSEEGGDIQGSQGEVPMTDNGESEAPMESVSKNKPLLTETITKFVKRNKQVQRPKILNESLIINDEFDKMLKSLDNITE